MPKSPQPSFSPLYDDIASPPSIGLQVPSQEAILQVVPALQREDHKGAKLLLAQHDLSNEEIEEYLYIAQRKTRPKTRGVGLLDWLLPLLLTAALCVGIHVGGTHIPRTLSHVYWSTFGNIATMTNNLDKDTPTPALVALLESGGPYASSQAIFLLRDKATQDTALIPTIGHMLNDRSENVQTSAIHALSQLNQHFIKRGNNAPNEAIKALSKALTHQDLWVRKGAAKALAKVGPQAHPALLKALQHKDPKVQLSVIQGLRFSHSKTLKTLLKPALPALSRLLRAPDFQMRKDFAWALGGTKQTLVIPMLKTALRDPVLKVREQAAAALGEIGHDKALPVLYKALFKGAYIDRSTQSAIIRAIGATKTHTSIDLLAFLIQTQLDPLGITAIIALSDPHGRWQPDKRADAIRPQALRVLLATSIRYCGLKPKPNTKQTRGILAWNCRQQKKEARRILENFRKSAAPQAKQLLKELTQPQQKPTERAPQDTAPQPTKPKKGKDTKLPKPSPAFFRPDATKENLSFLRKASKP